MKLLDPTPISNKRPPRWPKALFVVECIVYIALATFLIHACQAHGQTLELLSVSTNRPEFAFTAAVGTHAFARNTNYCWTATFRVTGTGVHELQWLSPYGFATMYPPVTNAGVTTVTFPVPTNALGFFTLKQ